MANKTEINLDKIFREIDKGSISDVKIAYQNIKDYIAKKVQEASKQAEEVVNEHQNFLTRINGN